MQATRRLFNSETVHVDTHGSHGPYDPLPAVNVKVRRGFEALKPEQWEGIRAQVRDYVPDLPAETVALFGRDYCERFESERGSEFYEVWYSEACSQGFERAEELARELFGAPVEVSSAGRSGGWLVVKGLPDLEDWHSQPCEEAGSYYLPSLVGSDIEGASFQDGTVLDSEANIFERWAFYVEACEAEAQDTPYRCADLLAVNVFAREEAARVVEFARVLPSGQWDFFKLAVPRKLAGHEALTAYALERAPELQGVTVSAVAVLSDPED